MDHLTFIVLSCAAVGAWIHSMRRAETPLFWKIVAVLAIALILGPYVIMAGLRAAGMWFDERAEAGLLVIAAMGLGFTAATGGMDGRKKQQGQRA